MQFQPGIGNGFRHSGCDDDADVIDCRDNDGERPRGRALACADGPGVRAAAAGIAGTAAGGSRTEVAAVPGLRAVRLGNQPDGLRRWRPVCAVDGAKTVPGSYTFNVVATSGGVTSTVSYSLTVQ